MKMKEPGDEKTLDMFEDPKVPTLTDVIQELNVPFMPRSRVTDKWTSYAAAFAMYDTAMSHRTRIYAALACLGPATHDELAKAVRLRPDQVWRRLPELAEKKLVIKMEQTRPGDSGCEQSLWRVYSGDKPGLSPSGSQRQGQD